MAKVTDDPGEASLSAEPTAAEEPVAASDPAGETPAASAAAESAPVDSTSVEHGPTDARAFRVDAASTMAIDAGPWTVGPDGVPGIRVEWLDTERAVALDTRDVDKPGREPVLLGPAEPPSRSGTQRREVVVGGWRVLLAVEPERTARLRERARRGRADAAHTGPLEVRAIIPGRVVAVSVAEGDTVDAGQQLLVVEAMKMQNELRSPRAGTVERIAVGVGQTVELAALLLVLR
jgi:biotin carboxyl carrier protein